MQFITMMEDLVHDNKYSRIYFNIIRNSRARATKRSSAKRLLGYVEGHHIVPQSVGPEFKKERDNITFLTSREHFICHLLLTKCMVDVNHQHSMAFAFFKMFNINPKQVGHRYTNSRFYAYANSLNSEACVVRNSKRVYAKGYKRPHNEETKLKIGISNAGSVAYYNDQIESVIYIMPGEAIPEGFVKSGNPKLIQASNAAVKGSIYIHNPVTGDEKRFTGDTVPEGYVEGRCYVFITDGSQTRQINLVTDIIPDGWERGRTLGSTKAKRRGNSGKPVDTPFGQYAHKLDFCDEYGIDSGFFDNLDCKIRNRASNKKLIDALISLGFNLSMTKAEIGFIC